MKKRVLVVYRHRPDVQPYADAVASTGAEPVLAEVGTGIELGSCNGLLLTGGSDVDPALYGEIASPETEPPDPERDTVEGRLIDEALTRELPLLGICRGLQMLNVHLGGSLVQHLPTVGRHVRRTPDRGLPAHRVVIQPGSLLASIARTETWEVNSRHHQAAARLANGFRTCATEPEDGTVEAIEMPDRRFVLAVQWHPENQALKDAEQRKLFDAFASAL